MPKQTSPRAPRTNQEMLNELMEWDGPHGPLTQAFIMYAVLSYAEKCAAAKPESMDSAIMSGHAWHATAVHVRDRLHAFYGRHDPAPPSPPPVVALGDGASSS